MTIFKIRENKKWIFIMVSILVLVIIKYHNNSKELLGTIICSALLFFFYSVAWHICKLTNVLNCWKNRSAKEIYIIIGITLCSCIVLLTVLLKQRYLYFWDFGGYWGKTINQSQEMFSNPIRAMKDLYDSINTQEYNNLIPIMLALPLKIFGTDFAVYALIIYVMFVIPSFIVIVGIVNNIWNKMNEERQISMIPTYSVIVGTSAFYMPVLLGYLDAFSLLCLSLIYLLLLDGYLQKFDFKKNLLLSLVLILTFLGRRYFAFAVVGVVCATVLLALYDILRRKSCLGGYIKNAVCLMGLILVLMVIFFGDFLKNSLSGTIQVAYSAYQTGGMIHNYKLLTEYVGLFWIVLDLLVILVLLLKKQYKKEITFLILSFFITSYLFYRIQSMGNHHYYIIILPIVIIAALGVNILKKINSYVYYFVMMCLVLNIYIVIDGMGIPTGVQAGFTNQRIQPKIRNDISELQLLANELKRYSDEGKSSYVLASSTIINDDMIRKINMPDELLAVPLLRVSSHVDLRDGFPVDFYDAQYVVVADPIQYHLGAENQRVIGILADEMLNNGRIGQKYQMIQIYHIDEGVQLKVYERMTVYTEEDKRYIAQLFETYYSEFPQLFRDKILG